MVSPDITALIKRHRDGDAAAFDELTAALYKELRRLAAYHLRAERKEHTLQPTALVHEAYLRLCRPDGPAWENRAHFLALAARVMRHVLVDHARARNRSKRAGATVQVPLDEALAVAVSMDVDLVALDEALTQLSAVDPDACRIVELRCFGGLTALETAELLGVSRATVEREWAAARAWLRSRLSTP